ncbi:hypothetical protein AAVH_27826 [Aphelenchoides avenae]|nr:hypothetical protein AAVH_27826 [Aphelenchus avenae]
MSLGEEKRSLFSSRNKGKTQKEEGDTAPPTGPANVLGGFHRPKMVPAGTATPEYVPRRQKLHPGRPYIRPADFIINIHGLHRYDRCLDDFDSSLNQPTLPKSALNDPLGSGTASGLPASGFLASA